MLYLPRFAVYIDRTVHLLYQFINNGHPKTGSPIFGPYTVIFLCKWLKQAFFHKFPAHTNSRILNLKLQTDMGSVIFHFPDGQTDLSPFLL